MISLYIHDEGFILTVEDQRAVKAIAYFKLHLFQIFNLRDGANVSALGLPIDVLSNGLRIMLPASEMANILQGANDYCEVMYDGIGSYITLRHVDLDDLRLCSCMIKLDFVDVWSENLIANNIRPWNVN